jgi:hypothetical protein
MGSNLPVRVEQIHGVTANEKAAYNTCRIEGTIRLDPNDPTAL